MFFTPVNHHTATPSQIDMPPPRHLLDLESWSAADLHGMLQLAHTVQVAYQTAHGKLNWLRGKVIITLFYENSTRTRVSFELAGKALGADVVNITASSSSVAKGESLRDTFNTLDALHASIIVMRHDQSGAAETATQWSRAAIINAGDGWHAHPSQALLDVYTLYQQWGAVKGKRIVIVGDVLHSRVVRSNCWALTTLGAEVVVCGPPTLVPLTFPRAYPHRNIHVEHSLARALMGADAVMALRLQRERMTGGFLPSLREYRATWGLTAARLADYPNLPILHPGPMNEGVEIDPEIAHSATALIEAQVANGMPVRMAILLWAAGVRDLPTVLDAPTTVATEVSHAY